MSEQFPQSQIVDAQKLEADGRVWLFELTPSAGGGVFRFKAGADATWLGNLYEGIGVSLTGDKTSSDGAAQLPRLVIGGDGLDLGPLKPLIHAGTVDGGLIRNSRILLDDLVNNRNFTYDRWYRVKRVDEYSSRRVTLILATYADSFGAKLPFRQFVPPAFPFVTLK